MQQDLLEELIINNDTEGIRKLLLENPSLINARTSHAVSPLMLSCFFNKPKATSVILEFVKEITLFEAASVGKFDEVAHQVYQNPNDL
ncbi:MAG TPA: hypothetical protein VFM79_09940, partial [Pelobium sp.]|nr:hypothetical protein [Pelobium sp.]